MVHFSLLFAVAAGLLVSPATGLSVETRQLPPTVSQIISSITSFGLVKDINVFITAQSLIDNTFSLNFDVQNLLPIEITIDSLSTDAGLNGEVFETISHTFASPGLVVSPLGTANSGNIANVPLPQGALAAIGIISDGKLDLSNLTATIRAITISGSGGISIPLSGLSQSGVMTTYTPNIAQFASTLASSALIQDINIFITPQSLVDNTVSLNFDIHNPLPVELTIDQLGTNAGLDGTTYATFSHSFASPGLVIPASGSINSGTIDNVALPQGALATLGIIPSGKLDLSSFSASTRDLTLNGAGGIPVPLSDLSQSSVPTTYTPDPADLANTLGTVGLVQSITIIFSLQTLVTNTVSLNFNIANPLPFEVTFDQLSTNGGLNGTTYVTLSHAFASPGLIVPALSNTNSGNIDSVPLPQGALATLGIVPAGKLDLSGLSASVRALTISGAGGIPIPLSGIAQTSVPTTYTGAALSPGLPLPLFQRRDINDVPTPAQILDILTSLGLIQDMTVFFSPTSLITNTVSISFDILNPLPIEITIDQMAANAGLNGSTFFTFSHTFASPGIVVAALGTTNSGTIDNVALPQGALATLGIVLEQELDFTSENIALRALSISGAGGIPIPLSRLTQTSIPTTYSLGGL